MSCVGSKCSESTMLLFLDEEMIKRADKPNQRNDPLPCFSVAVHEGLLVMDGTGYNFSHDQVQYAAYSLIPEEEKHLWHLQIGRKIWNNVAEKRKDKVIFTAVDQMNYGISSVESGDQKVFLAKLNLRAGGKAMSLSAFSSCAYYFSTGIKLLSREHWETNYELSLHLHNYYAEAEYCNGNFSQVREVTKTVLEMSTTFHDQLRAHFVLIKTLSAENRLHEAIKTGISVLTHLGYHPPLAFSDKSAIDETFKETKATIESMTDDEFFTLTAMED
eukprot:6236739-Ditylum_brightwellii.AAC.1